MKMNKGYLLATAASAALAPIGAQAADLPTKTPMITVPAVSWAGWYAGLHAGAAWQQAHNSNEYNSALGNTTATSFIGGGQIGYNWQNGNLVYGFEVDGSWLSGKGTNSYSTFATVENQINWLATARGRMGLAVGNTMAYATGGLAFGGVKNAIVVIGGNPWSTKSESKTRVGFAIGGGVEHMVNRNWTVGLEALFVDLGRSSITTPVPFTGGSVTNQFSNQAVIARMKMNYKF